VTRGASAAELARALTPTPESPFSFGTVQEVDLGTPNSLQVTFAGSSTVIAGMRYASCYLSPAAGDYVLIVKVGKNDYLVLTDLA
jgi:hypothetical protein